MEPNLFLILADKYLSGTATQPEKELVESYYAILSETETDEVTAAMLARVEKKLFAGVKQAIRQQAPVRRIRWVRVAAAAILLFAIAGTWLIVNHQTPAAVAKADIAPGREGSKLKLADGREILVDTAKEGLLAVQGKIQVYKENGKIVYKGVGDELVYNEISTAKGRFSTAILPDGSTVWLNASSSVRYPLQFQGQERKVSMTGEVSFKVVHNAEKPFKVMAAGQTIEDIGTEFDVNAYTDEPAIKTTLIEGSASVKTATNQFILKPGQQAVTNAGTETIAVNNDVNTDNVIAWRNGKFRFEDADLPTVMRQLARWYDVEVVYEAPVPNNPFSGGTFRNENLSEVLKVLELSGGVHFRIEGKKLFVRP